MAERADTHGQPGHAIGAGRPGDAGSAGQPGRPGRPGRPLALWGGAAALVLMAGGVAIGTVNATVYSPEAEVERYLDALADGDGAAALGLARGGEGSGDADLAPGTATTLLDGKPLAAGYAALQDVTVTRGGESPDGVGVVVEYRVDGRDHATTFTVDREGRDWLFFDRWRITPLALSTVRVAPTVWPAEAAGQPIAGTVNGAQVSLSGGQSPAQDFAVLPPLAVDASAASTYLEAAPGRTVVDGADPAQPIPLALDLEYTDEVAREANRQLDEYLDRCTGQQVLHPAGCPMGYDTLNRIPPESISWSIAQDPTVEIAPLPGGGSGTEEAGGVEAGDVTAGAQQGTDVTVAAPVQAEARLTLEEIDLVTGERRRVDHEEPVEIEADLQVGPESVRYAPRVP